MSLNVILWRRSTALVYLFLPSFFSRLQDKVALTMFRLRTAFGFLLFGAVLLAQKIFEVGATDCESDSDCYGGRCCVVYPYGRQKICSSTCVSCYDDTDCDTRRECCAPNNVCTTSHCTPFPSWKITLIVIGVFLAIALPVASLLYCRCQSRRTDRCVLIPCTIPSSNMVSMPNFEAQSAPSHGHSIGQDGSVYSEPTQM